MNAVDYKNKFINKHNKGDWHVDTSPMDENGRYIKHYVFEDGAQLWEVNQPAYEQAETVVRGLKVKVEVKLLETEMWNTDDATSVKFYEVF